MAPAAPIDDDLHARTPRRFISARSAARAALLHGGEGQADAALSKAHGGQSGIHGDWVDLGKQDVHQRQKLALQGGPPLPHPRRRTGGKGPGPPGDYVGQHGDAAGAAHGEDRHNMVVVAGINGEPVSGQGGQLHKSWPMLPEASFTAAIRG